MLITLVYNKVVTFYISKKRYKYVTEEDDLKLISVSICLKWDVWENYVIEDGWLVPTGNLSKKYNVQEEKDIATRFAKVGRQDGKRNKTLEQQIESLVEFMKSYGSLGQTINTGTPVKTIDGNDKTFLFDGDQLGWALDHATFVNLTLQLSYLINNPIEALDNDKLYNLLLSIKEKQENLGTLRIPTLVSYEHIKFNFEEAKSDPLKFAESINEKILELNIGKPTPVIENRRVYFKLTSLIQWIYNEVTRNYTSQKLAMCIECGAIFYADRKRTLCPPLTEKGESPCGKRKKVREFRVRKEKERKEKERKGKEQINYESFL